MYRKEKDILRKTKEQTEREGKTDNWAQWFEGKSCQREIRMKCEIIIQPGINHHLSTKEGRGGEREGENERRKSDRGYKNGVGETDRKIEF